MNDYRNLLVGTIIVAIILYMIVKSQPKTTIPETSPVDVSKSGEEKFTISQITRIAAIKKGKADMSHRTGEKLANFSTVAEHLQTSIEPSMRRSSPMRGSQRYAASDFAGPLGFITVI
jgi:hypothetical protein